VNKEAKRHNTNDKIIRNFELGYESFQNDKNSICAVIRKSGLTLITEGEAE
jgi:hypothetical protein